MTDNEESTPAVRALWSQRQELTEPVTDLKRIDRNESLPILPLHRQAENVETDSEKKNTAAQSTQPDLAD